MNKNNKLTVEIDEAGQRLDKWVSEQTDLSRSKVQKLIKSGDIIRNQSTTKANVNVSEYDVIHIHLPDAEDEDIRPEALSLDIVYEDDDIIVVNKPSGMVVHPAPGHVSGTLVNGLLAYADTLSDLNGDERPGIVHRIDRDTSGLLVVAKHNQAHRALAEQLQTKTMKRTYQALVLGQLPHDEGTVDAPIGRDPKQRQRMTVTNQHSKQAVTHFTVQQRFVRFTWLECRLETGRTHQIRVHMKYIGHPVAGDPKYSKRSFATLTGQALHASSLQLEHPRDGRLLTFSADIPEEMSAFLSNLTSHS